MRQLILILILVAQTFATCDHIIQDQGTWKSLPNITQSSRQEHTTVFLPPRSIYVLGGIVNGPPDSTTDPTTSLVQMYSISRRTWKTSSPLPKPLNHINAAVVHGKIYVLGGLAPINGGLSAGGSWGAVDDCWVYDPTHDSWRVLSGMPLKRGSAAVGVYGSVVYLAGGLSSLSEVQETVDTASAYDTITGNWTALPPLPAARDHAGGAVVGHTFYVIGGRDHGQANGRDTVFALDLRNVTRGWVTMKGRMPTARGGVAVAVLGSKVYAFGGEGNPYPASLGVFNQTEVYNTSKDCWEKLGAMDIPRHGTSAVAVDGSIYIPGGGIRQSGAPVSTFNKFTP